VQPVTGIGSATLPEARGTATVVVLDDNGTRQSLSFDAHLDRRAPVNLVGLAGLKAAGVTSADWNGSEFRWHFTRGPASDQDFTITTQPTAEAHGLHAFDIMHALGWRQRVQAQGTEHAPAPAPDALAPTPAATESAVPVPAALVATTPLTLRAAHEALGHISVHRLSSIAATVQGLSLARHTKQDLDEFRCIDCAAGKQPRAPRPSGPHDPVATKFGVHCMVDVIGPLPPSRRHYRYLIVFIDAMGALRTFALRSTADSSTALDAWARVWQSNTSTRPTIQMDQASYFSGGNFQAQLIKLGWHQTWSPPYAHSLAGRVERMNRLLLDRVRPMLYGANLSAAFWVEASAYAAWLTFRQVTTRGTASPYELMHSEPPDLRHAHRFGALVHYRDDSPANKLAPRTRQAIFMGIPLDTSFGTVLLYTLDTGEIVESRDYSVFPDITPGAKLRNVTTDNSAIPVTDRDPAIELLIDSRVFETVAGPATASTSPPLIPATEHDTNPTTPASPSATTNTTTPLIADTSSSSDDSASDDNDDYAGAGGDDSDSDTNSSAPAIPSSPPSSSPSSPSPPSPPPPSPSPSPSPSPPPAPTSSPQQASPMRRPRAAHNTPFAQHKSHSMPTNIDKPSNSKTYANQHWQPAYGHAVSETQQPPSTTLAPPVPSPTAPEIGLDNTTAQLNALALTAAQPVWKLGVPPTVPSTVPSTTLTCPVTWNDYIALPPHQRAIWARALHKEFDAMKTMNTLSPVPIHIARKRTPRIIQTRWLFKIKAATEPGGEQVAKARLVCRGFQEPGLSKDNVFAPTVTPATLRVMVAIALCFGWRSAYVDFATAFLNSTVGAEEHLYVYPPPGVDMPGFVFQLYGALYGLASSPVRWFNTVVPVLLKYGLQQHPQDPCFFWMLGSDSMPPLILVLFVDDIRVAGPGDAIERFIAYLRSTHKCTSKAQGEYLSMTFDDPVSHTISAHQTRYATDLLKDLSMGNCIPRLSPLPAGHTLLAADESELLAPEAAAWYRTGVGKVGYLLQTKPELCFAFSELSRHLINPGQPHLDALEHLIGYVAKNHNTGFTVFRDDLPLRITAYSDSNYATNIDDRKSVSGKFLFVGRTPVVFGTSRQTTLATSSAEAELTALSTTCFAVQELRDLLEPLGLLASGPSRVYCDSEAAIATVMGGSRQLVRGLAKHHAVRLLKLRELIEDGVIDLQSINTIDNIADILTKANPAPVLRAHLAAMHAGTVWGLPDARGIYPPAGRRPRQ